MKAPPYARLGLFAIAILIMGLVVVLWWPEKPASADHQGEAGMARTRAEARPRRSHDDGGSETRRLMREDDSMERALCEPLDRLRERAAAGDDVDFLDEFRDLLADDATLDAAMRQLAEQPYEEHETMLLRVLCDEFGKRTDMERIQSWLKWYRQAPEGLGKAQMGSVLLAVSDPRVLEYLAMTVLPDEAVLVSGAGSLLYYGVRAVMTRDPDAYFKPMIEAALAGNRKTRGTVLDGIFAVEGFTYERSMGILEGDSIEGREPDIARAAIFGLAKQADERSKEQLLSFYRDADHPHRESVFEALRMMQSHEPALFSDAEKSEFMAVGDAGQ